MTNDHPEDASRPVSHGEPSGEANHSASRPDERTASPSASTFGEAFSKAAKNSGLAPLASGDAPTGKALLSAMGGIRGLVEAILPGLVFLVAYSLTRELVPSLIAPVVIGVGFAVARLVQRQSLTQAIGGLLGIALSAVLALLSGRAEDYYVPGFWTNGAYALGLLVSVVIGWPVVGLIAGYLLGGGTSWRSHPGQRRAMRWLTLVWAAMFVARLVVQLPLYYSGNVEALGATRLLMGIPLYAPLLVLSWLVVRAVFQKPAAANAADAA
ncbi:DUF3159 domain-containing protein [Plantibacter sp. YIM 135249]|uniref:DUF3159 domain-containing protein n=1 Tax=Plantibacter sp. YIM 135249 TaxID=3423918 RepID=UPI003D346BC9